MSVTHPDLCRRVALRHSLGLVAVCSAAPLLEVTHWAFALESLPLNLYMVIFTRKYLEVLKKIFAGVLELAVLPEGGQREQQEAVPVHAAPPPAADDPHVPRQEE